MQIVLKGKKEGEQDANNRKKKIKKERKGKKKRKLPRLNPLFYCLAHSEVTTMPTGTQSPHLEYRQAFNLCKAYQ